jgi:hypothetical protein
MANVFEHNTIDFSVNNQCQTANIRLCQGASIVVGIEKSAGIFAKTEDRYSAHKSGVLTDKFPMAEPFTERMTLKIFLSASSIESLKKSEATDSIGLSSPSK